MKTLFSFLGGLALLMSASCAKDDNDKNVLAIVSTTPSTNLVADSCTKYYETPVVGLTGPDAVPVNQEAQYVVKFAVYNGCGSLGGFQTVSAENRLTVAVMAKYGVCYVCTQAVRILTANYSVRAFKPGVYYLIFKKQDGSTLTQTLTVK